MDPRRVAAIEAEADRLFGVFLRIRLLAQKCDLDLFDAGAEAVRGRLVTEEDWRTIREAIAG